VNPRLETKTEYSVVKCGLYTALEGSMNDDEYQRFSDLVEQHVEAVSHMMRRATLFLLFHVTRLLRAGLPIENLFLLFHVTRLLRAGLPIENLFDQKDTFWKDCLRIGQCVPEPCVRRQDGQYIVDPELSAQLASSLDTSMALLDAIAPPPATNPPPYFDPPPATNPPPYFDQVLCYAGHTLATVVANNAWVPLFTRLTRLARVMLARWREEGLVCNEAKVYADTLVKAVRSATPELDDLPLVAREWVRSVRERLGVIDGVPAFDDHGMDAAGVPTPRGRRDQDHARRVRGPLTRAPRLPHPPEHHRQCAARPAGPEGDAGHATEPRPTRPEDPPPAKTRANDQGPEEGVQGSGA